MRIRALAIEQAQPGSPITMSRFFVQHEAQYKPPGYTKKPPVMYWHDYFPLDLNIDGTEHWAFARDTMARLKRDEPNVQFRVIKRIATIETEVVES